MFETTLSHFVWSTTRERYERVAAMFETTTYDHHLVIFTSHYDPQQNTPYFCWFLFLLDQAAARISQRILARHGETW